MNYYIGFVRDICTITITQKDKMYSYMIRVATPESLLKYFFEKLNSTQSHINKYIIKEE